MSHVVQPVFQRRARIARRDVDLLRETLGDCARRQAIACSRPPEPMTRIFMY